MATSRRNGPTTRRLVEGQTYQLPIPRRSVRLMRNLTLSGVQMVQSTTVIGGRLVPVGEPTRAERQQLVVGSIVQLASSRNSYLRGTLLDPALDPEQNRNTWTVGRFKPADYWVVRALAADGKLMRVSRLFVVATYQVTKRVNAAGQIEFFRGEQRPYDWATSTHTVVPEAVLSAAEVTGVVHTTCVGTNSNDERAVYNYPLARPRHVFRHVPLEEVEGTLLDALRLEVKSVAALHMYKRLAEEEAKRQNVGKHASDIRWHRLQSRRTRDLAAKELRGYLSSAKMLWNGGNRTSAQSNLQRAYNIRERMARNSAQYAQSHDVARGMVNRWAVKNGLGNLNYATGCCHFHEGASQHVVDNYGSEVLVCPDCFATAVVVINNYGDAVRMLPSVRTYMWSDGTRHTNQEPGVIGNRHSGKGVVGYVAPLSTASRDSILTLGLELEMQAYNGEDREGMARALKAKLEASNLLDKPAARKYMHFEEDGSTGSGGFEMVTGYTDITTHSKLLKAVLCNANGGNAWAGKLRSHNASGACCGIHVHIQKPKHLIHAMKMRYFVNAPGSERLITDVARRYNQSYARIDRGVVNTPVAKAAVNAIRSAKGYSSTATPMHERTALQRINGDRYEALNFQNINTVEFRIFRGSMLHETVMACMEFTQAVWEFTRYTTAVHLTVPKFLEFICKAENRAATRSLREYLKKKGHDVVVPKEMKKGPTTTQPEFVEPPHPADTAQAWPQEPLYPQVDLNASVPIPRVLVESLEDGSATFTLA